MREIALVTCARLPDLDPDDQALVAPLTALGYLPVPQVWDDPSVDWDRFELNVLRSTWDYTDRRAEFVSWARGMPRLANSAVVVEWNTDKLYLRELEAAGIAVTPTTWLFPGDAVSLPGDGEFVIKPSVGAGSMDAGRYDLADTEARSRARAHAERLLGGGQTVMLQPFAAAIEERGETGVIFVGGRFSHAIRKALTLTSETPNEVDALYVEERIEARQATAAEIDIAHRAIDVAANATGGHDLLYARVDMVPDDDGNPMIMELELTEPSLFMVTDPTAPQRFAEAIAERARRESKSR
jgi:glutathione synthase/RimK-type ligase-like ATP-grasp enzyme